MSKAIITVVGKDTVGIIAKVCTYLAENHVNIVDVSAIEKTFGEVADELEKVGEEIGVTVKIQREEIFTKMHRI